MPFGFAGAGAGGGVVGLNPAGSEPLVEPLGCGGGGGGAAFACCCILVRYSFSYASSCSFLDALPFPPDAVSAGLLPAGSVPFGFGAGGGAVCVCAEPVAVDVIPYPAKYFVLGWYASFSRVAKYLLDG